MKAVVVLALVVAFVAGCGSGGSSPSPSSSPVAVASSMPVASSVGASPGSAAAATAEPAETAGDTSASPNDQWLDRAAAVIEALGYEPSDDGTVTATIDSDTGAPITRVEYRDGWALTWDAGTRLVHVFRGVIPDQSAKPLTRAQDTERIAAFASALGYVPPAGVKPDVQDTDGWQETWPRSVNGIRVWNDGASILLQSDGAFLGFNVVEHALAAKPARVLTRAQAEAALLAASTNTRPSSLGPIARAELMWAPAASPGLATPTPEVRLCWVLYREELHVSDTHKDWARAFVDAGTGKVLWGDSTA